MEGIKAELRDRIAFFHKEGRLVEAQRIEQRTRFDLEMLNELGFCKGIENYSRHLSGRKAGDPPPTLLDYLPAGSLMFIDESHVSISQVGGMYKGDRSRKENLVEYGFRLPSALDNRPLKFAEFEQLMPQTVFVSATPADYEKQHQGQVVEQVVRPTGLVDPEIQVRPASTQVDDLLSEIHKRIGVGERVLVTTLTKRMAEDLTDYLRENGIRIRYLHSDIDTVERVEIIRDLRLGEFDVLVGINLLREGLDIPEVSLVAILDADKEGFLRSERSLIQTIGRAARHIHGTAILYADRMTDSMAQALDGVGRGFQVDVGDEQDRDLVAKLDGLNFVTFFVEQEGAHIHWYLGMDGGRIVLHGLLFQDAQDVQGRRFGGADVAGAGTAGAGDVAGFRQGGAEALTGQFHQAEAADFAHLYPGPVMTQGVPQPVFHLPLIAGAFHVDEVDDHQTAQVPQPQLAGQFLGGFQVGLQGRFLNVLTPGSAAGIDVTGHQGFRVIDDDGAAGGQIDLAGIGGFDLMLNLEAGEEGNIILVTLDPIDVVGHGYPPTPPLPRPSVGA